MSRIFLKQSNVPNRIPAIDILELGELGINSSDGKIFLKKYNQYFDEALQETITEEEIVEFTSTIPVKNTLYVQKDGNDKNDGTTWSSAFATIEQALAATEIRNELTLIQIGPGIYYSQGHIDVPDNTVIQAAHRSVFFRPVAGYEERNVFRLGSGCFLEGIIFEDWRLDDLDNPTEGFAISFRPGARITRVPYAHKVAVRTTPYWTTISPPLDRSNGNPLVGRGAGVVLADASIISPDSIYPNIMTWGATPVSHNGIGYCAKNGGLINAVNAISMWAHKHFYAIDGGQIILSSCSTQFGDYTMVAKGTRSLINPVNITDTITVTIDQAASTLINNSTSTIISNLLTELTDQSFTTDWPENYIDFTERDAGLFLQVLKWTLETANEKPMLDFAKGFFNTNGNRVFDGTPYDYDKCYRDTKLITEAVAYDLLFNSNYRSINAALSYYRANASTVITDQKNITLEAIQRQKTTFGSYLSGTSLLRSNSLFDEIINIITAGETTAATYLLTDPVGYDTGYNNARTLLVENKTFIQDEIDAWIAFQVANNISPFTTSFVYNVAACRRDVGLIIDALRYDVTYGGNLETYNAAIAYFVGSVSQYGSNEKLPTIAAYNRLKSIIGDISKGILISKTTGNNNTQIVLSDVGSTEAAIFLQDRIDNIITTIQSDGTPPVKILPNTLWPEQEFKDSFAVINTNTTNISNDVLRHINIENKTLLGAFIYSWEFLRDQINSLVGISNNAITVTNEFVNALTKTILNPSKVFEPSTITAIGHTWTGIMVGVALTKIPPVRNLTNIQESILELDSGLVIASGQDDQGSALFIGGMQIDADTGEISGPPFDTAVNRIATRAAIARSF